MLTAAAKAISGQCFMIDCLLKDVGVRYLKRAERQGEGKVDCRKAKELLAPPQRWMAGERNIQN